MLIILTSAKTMTGTSKIKAPAGTTPRFSQEASEIALNMAQFSVDELRKILKLNPKLALENYNRFQEFHTESIKPLSALLAYTGVVFKNINPKDFTGEDFRYANEHLRIASICYGLLRPLDRIKPYRMEYEVKFPELGEGNMYNFWRPRQTELLIKEVKKNGNILMNLASQEIQGAYDWKKVGQSVRIITPEFKVLKDGKPQTIVIYTKMARGQMTRHILKNRITDPEALKAFTREGFAYDESLSDGDNWVFLQS
ncbi:MAG: peroxide stress protein YaaA [Parabacteroides sp.]|nr:peroxide stress protein YaaA [Parabacteroides sp.]